MRIQHNIMAMNAYRNYSSNTSALSKNLEKLSSGYKINRAGDDAAGLAISEKMRAQITGLETAQKNAKDGISLIQTAEGALTEVHDMLNRMVELADQSANGTYDNEVDRANLQKEFDALRSEIDRISQASNFNGINLLNGDQKQKLVESALGAQLDGIDGMSPDAATAANITVKLDKAPAPAGTEPSKTTDGQKPSAAVTAGATIELNGIKEVGTVTGTRVNGTYVSSEMTIGASGETGDFAHEMEITYLDADGKEQTATVTTAATGLSTRNAVLNDFVGKINADATLSALFDATADTTTGKLTLTAKTAAGKAAVKDLEITATGDDDSSANSTLKIGFGTNAANVKDSDEGSAVIKPTGVKLDTTGATVEIGGTTYTKVASAGDVKNADTEFHDFNSLQALLEKKGITTTAVNGGNDLSHVTFAAKQYEVTIGTGKIETGKTTIDDLGKFDVDGAGSKTLSDLYDVKINGKAITDWASTDVINGGDKIELVAKTTGAQLPDVAKALDDIKGDAQITTTTGVSEGSGGAATTTQYELTFDFTKLAGGQTFEIDGKTYEFVTDVATSSTATGSALANQNIAINIGGMAMNTDAGKKAIATEIRTALTAGSNTFANTTNFDVAAIPGGNITSDTWTLSIKGKPGVALDNTNLGQVRVSESVKASGAITSNYVAGHAENSGDKGTYATVEYDFDISKLKENDVITIGDTSITVVKNPPTGVKLGKNEISADDAVDPDKLARKFEEAGYKAGKIAINTGDKKLTITDTKAGGSGDVLAAGAGKLSLSTVADGEITATSADGTLDITTGTTTYKDIMNKEIDGNKVSDLFTVKVNGKEVTLDNGSTTFKAGDEITFEAKMKGEQTAKIMDAFNFTSGANVDKVNGTAEGQAGSASKTQYDLNFDITKMADGQHFSIGNKEGKSVTFELSTDGTANKEGAVAINIGGMDPTTVDGQKKILEAIKTAVSDTAKGMGTDFDVKTGDLNGGKFSMNLTAKKEGPDYNLGAVRVSEAPTGAISGTYSAASSAAGAKEGSFAEVSYALDLSKLQNGDVLEIGGTKIEITDGSSAGNKLNINDAKDAEKLISAFEQNGFDTGRLAIADDKLTVTGKKVGQTAADLAAGMGKVSLTSTTRDMSAKEGGLVLQIGDTSDSFNQLTVSIDKMDCEALGIDAAKININSQNGAADSVSVLKNAINMVSSTRGDLGALQNRLEHTINNLSVMTENIQDAESTIRDVDVAQEMMEYTKNNILVQSAQAMLAQANQVPQGVLQLLG